MDGRLIELIQVVRTFGTYQEDSLPARRQSPMQVVTCRLTTLIEANVLNTALGHHHAVSCSARAVCCSVCLLACNIIVLLHFVLFYLLI